VADAYRRNPVCIIDPVALYHPLPDFFITICFPEHQRQPPLRGKGNPSPEKESGWGNDSPQEGLDFIYI